MKKHTPIFFLFLVLSLLFAPTCEAQFLEKLQKKAEKRAQQRVENKIDKQVDKAVDKAVDAPEKALEKNKKTKKNKKSEPKKSPTDNMETIIGGQDVKLQDSYEFQQKVVYEMTGVMDDKPYEMTYWFGPQKQVFAAEINMQTNMFIIYELQQDALIMISQDDKTLRTMPLAMFGAVKENAEEDAGNNTFKKVDGIKKIHGYDCQKYQMVSDEMEGEFWFTKDVDITQLDLMKTFIGTAKKNSRQTIPEFDKDQKGFLMSMTTKDKTTNAVTTMSVKEISKSKKIITTSNYKKQ